jgi:hypothetical protein
MSLWEYKIITSGKGGFASPALLEKFLNDLGRDEWEIVQFHTQPDNFLVFTGLARRPTQRDWTLEGAAAAAAKAEADKLRAEFEAKFKAATSSNAPAEEPPASFLEEKLSPDDGFRKPVDTSHDAEEEEETKDEGEDDWDKLTAAEEDELPTFFDAIKPHMRRNQRGPGMSVGVDYLAKKWDQSEEDLKGALAECGFTIPEDEDAKPEYLEFEGDLYWININRRGELWINTKEKPRPVFRAVKAQKAMIEEEPKSDAPKPEEKAPRSEERGHKHDHRREKPEHRAPAAETPQPAPSEGQEPNAGAPAGELALQGPELLEKIRPMMRRNRRGPGGSGSASFLSRALKCREADLIAAFKALGLVVPSSPNEKPVNVEIANGIWWVNTDSRGNVWINGRDKKPGETIENAPATETSAVPAEPASAPDTIKLTVATDAPFSATGEPSATDAVPTPEVTPAVSVESQAPAAMGQPEAAQASTGGNAALSAARAHLKESRGTAAARIERLAETVGQSPDDLIAQFVAAGLVVPEKPREKPVSVEQGGEAFWLTRNAKGELWLNAKPVKSDEKKDQGDESGTEPDSDAPGEKKSRRPRSRKKAD